MCADTGVKTHAIDDGLRVESFHFGVGVQLIEVAHTQGQVGVGKKFHSLGFGQTHKKCINIFFYRPFLQQGSKGLCRVV